MGWPDTQGNRSINYEKPHPSEAITELRRTPAVVIASADPELRDELAETLLGTRLTVVLVNGVEALALVMESEDVVACLCGFLLADGNFRDVMIQTKEQAVEIPVILASAPASPSELKDVLDCLIAGAFDYVCHPFHRNEVQRIVWSAIQAHCQFARVHAARRHISSTYPNRFRPRLI